MTVEPGDLRAVLRSLPVLTGSAPEFDPRDAADDPVSTFVSWFSAAVAAGVQEPHAMTLSTVDASGAPDARMLILKDVDAAGWHFAVSAASAKGAQLAANHAAALTFYWPQLVRQVRVRGRVIADSAELASSDFLARSPAARAFVVVGRQSQPLADPADVDDELAGALAQLEAEPTLVPAQWVSYAVRPDRVEFWQGDAERRHQRLLYTAQAGGWRRSLLWP